MSKKNSVLYAVVSHYSFDLPQVDLFATYEEAKEYLEKTAKEELRIDVEENGWDSRLENVNEGYRLTTIIDGVCDTTEFEIASMVNVHTNTARKPTA
jgi:hypothetical protein